MSDQEEIDSVTVSCENAKGKESDKDVTSKDKVIDIRQLKKARSSTKGILSKKQNEIKELMLDANNLSGIKQKLSELEAAVKKFQSAHQLVHESLKEYDVLESSRLRCL